MDVVGTVQVLVAVTIPLVVLAIIVNRTVVRKGIGVRSIQFVGLVIGISAIVLLALQRVIDGSVVGTLLGGTFGYLLSKISKFDESTSDAE